MCGARGATTDGWVSPGALGCWHRRQHATPTRSLLAPPAVCRLQRQHAAAAGGMLTRSDPQWVTSRVLAALRCEGAVAGTGGLHRRRTNGDAAAGIVPRRRPTAGNQPSPVDFHRHPPDPQRAVR